MGRSDIGQCGRLEQSVDDRLDKHEHPFSESDWPFSDPTNALAISTRQVVWEGHPVMRVVHNLDGNWQVLCSTTTDLKEALVVCLGCAFQRHPSIGAVADLPRGWTAWRDSPAGPWRRGLKEPESEEE